MKKKIISVFFALCMILALLPTVAFADGGGDIRDLNGDWHYLLPNGKEYAVSGDGWSWDGDGTLVLSGFTGKRLSLGYTTHLVLEEGSVNTFEIVKLNCVAGSPALKIEGGGELIATSHLDICQADGPVLLADNLQMTGGSKKEDNFPLTYDTNISELTINQIPKTSNGTEATYVRIGPASLSASQNPNSSANPDKLSKNTDGANTTQASNAAATWANNDKGWWIQYADGTYLTNEWYQSPTSGLWYYMGADGYMLTNTTTPDGYKVNAEGVWVQ